MPSRKKSAAGRGKTTQAASRRVSKGRTNRSGNKTRTNSGSSSVLVLVYDFFAGTYFGRISVATMLLCLIVLINFLISGDRFNWFFTLTGIELVVAAAGGWLYFLLRDDGE